MSKYAYQTIKEYKKAKYCTIFWCSFLNIGLIVAIALTAFSVYWNSHMIYDIHYFSSCEHTFQTIQSMCSVKQNYTCESHSVANYPLCTAMTNGTCVEQFESNKCIFEQNGKMIRLPYVCVQSIGYFCSGCLISIEEYTFLVYDEQECKEYNKAQWGKCGTKEGQLYTNDPNKHAITFMSPSASSPLIFLLPVFCFVTLGGFAMLMEDFKNDRNNIAELHPINIVD